MKATLLFATALCFAASAHAQQVTATEPATLERSAAVPSADAVPSASEMATLTSAMTATSHLRMYPVPTNGSVTADCPDGMLTIEVRDLNGRLVMRDNQLNGIKRFTFDIGRPGTYIVDVLDRMGLSQRSRFIRN
ncbi:MAG: T9SS type A sorting domain-containing protein [Flavobacteriales bacterium]|nr:T9SS type A sorting domain-containing protein [Flavobacteriales bacterium]